MKLNNLLPLRHCLLLASALLGPSFGHAAEAPGAP